MPWPDILLIDKPEGITSFDVIRRLRKRYSDEFGEKAPKMGHAGTLDPAASGLMIIGVGIGTKKLTDYIKLDKAYVAEIILGYSTTTGDKEGELLEEADVSDISESEVLRALQHMTGSLRLPVSAYSAIKKDGKPMYERAREAAKIGELVSDVPIRDMTVYENELLDLIIYDKTKLKVQVRFLVGSGTYIRSLGEELGRRLGLPASLAALRRTQIGEFDLSQCSFRL